MLKENFKLLIKDNISLFGSLLSVQFIGFFGIFVKYVQSEYNSGYQVAARTIGLTDRHELSFLFKLSFFREDILFNLIIIPFGFFIIFYFVNRKLSNFHLYINILLVSLLSFIFYIDLYSLGNIGKFLSLDLFVDSIRWAANNPESIRDYLSISGLFKLIFIILFSTFIIFIAKHVRFSIFIAKLSLLVTFISLLFSIAAYSVKIKSFPLHKSVIRATIESLNSSNFAPIDLSHLNGKALERYYHTFSGINLSKSQEQENIFRGKEIDADILLFVVETMPNAVFDFTKDTKKLPAISKLLDKAFVSSKHFTTCPITTSAIFSLLSSCYPMGIRKNILRNISKYRKFGLMSILRESSYQTSVYSPIANGYYADIPLYNLLGNEKVYLSPEEPYCPKQVEEKTQNFIRTLPCSKTFSKEQLKNIHDLLYFDLMAFEKMKADIISLKTSNKRFIFLFIPQLSHGPWPNLYNRRK